MTGIVACGAYVPRLRLQRKAVAEANAWYAPGLRGSAKGERAMANWDEDALTMAVEAGRDCLPSPHSESGRGFIDAIHFASTSAPFADRSNAGVVARALSLPEAISAIDFGGSQRAGVSALISAFDSVAAGRITSPLVVAGERRKARAASAQEMSFGDAAAAILVGTNRCLARLIGSHSLSVDFVDHFRAAGETFDYGWEERWIRDEGYAKIVPEAISALLAKTGVDGATVAHLVLPTPFARLDRQIAERLGISAQRVRDNLAGSVGDSGSAHALLMLCQALEEARTGERILVVQFGQGCDAVLLERTDVQTEKRGVATALARRKEESNYLKFLAFNGLIQLERGMRAEVDRKTSLSVLHRKNEMLNGLVGGECRICGTAQFPRSRICVNPNCHATDSQEAHSFAESDGTVLSWSADYLTYSMAPPSHYGMITFVEGGRLMADITDVEPGQIEAGSRVRMAFRIKEFDEKRGFRRYFWKAVPV